MTRRRNRNPKPAEQAPVMTVADYYRMRLTQVPLDPTPPSWRDYLHVSTRCAAHGTPPQEDRQCSPAQKPTLPNP
jgi:hypothetical protein